VTTRCTEGNYFSTLLDRTRRASYPKHRQVLRDTCPGLENATNLRWQPPTTSSRRH
jgi:hypothetical protein